MILSPRFLIVKIVQAMVMVLCCALVCKVSHAQNVVVLNIQWQPYYYKDHRRISGFARDIVDKVTKHARVSAEFGFDVWSRVYQEGMDTPNTIIAGVGRRPDRENLFHWIGPINKKQNIYAYGLKSSDTNVQSINDVGDYLTAVERNMYYHDFMIQMGFENQTYAVSDVSSLIKLLMVGRVDFILLEKERMEVEFARLGYNLDDIEAKALAFSAQSYMTLSKSSDEELAKKLKNSYTLLQKAGEIVLH